MRAINYIFHKYVYKICYIINMRCVGVMVASRATTWCSRTWSGSCSWSARSTTRAATPTSTSPPCCCIATPTALSTRWHTHTHAHKYIRASTHERIYTRLTHVRIHAYMYPYAHAHMYTRLIHVRMHIRTHAHMHPYATYVQTSHARTHTPYTFHSVLTKKNIIQHF